MKWFRFYNEAYKNPKIRRMRPELFKFWVQFLCVASDSPVRGVIESMDHLACTLGLRYSLVERLTRELEASKLLVISSTGSLEPYHWSERQPPSDDDARRKKEARQRAYDEEKADNKYELSGDTPKNVRALDLELDRDKETQKQDDDVSSADGLISDRMKHMDDCCPCPGPSVGVNVTVMPAKPKPKRPEVAFVKPDYIPDPVWDEFKAVRKQKGGKDTSYAYSLVVKELEKLRCQGHDPIEVINQSIRCKWIDVFPIRDKAQNSGFAPKTRTEPPPPSRQNFKTPVPAEFRKHDPAFN